MKKVLLLLALTGVIFSSCNKNESEKKKQTLPVDILVLNEGMYQYGNGSISAVYQDGSVEMDVFEAVNEAIIGDTPQHLAYIKGYYYVVVNNSEKIEVLDARTMERVQTIKLQPESSPRYIQQINENEAVVSDMYNNYLVLIDLNNFAVKRYINTVYAYERMTVAGGYLFATAPSSDKVIRYDLTNIQSGAEEVVDGIEGNIDFTGNLLVDKNGKVWVMTSTATGMLLNCVDPSMKQMVKKIDVPFIQPGDEKYEPGAIIGKEYMNRWDLDAAKANLYFCVNILENATTGASIGAVFMANVDEYTYVTEPARVLDGLVTLYGFALSPQDEIYVADCNNWSAQRGYLKEFHANGTVTSKRVGIFPSQIHFTANNK